VDEPPLRASGGGVYLSFHVTASAKKDSIAYAEGILKVKVTQAPEDGKANKAVLRLLKAYFGRCELTFGSKSRKKTVYIPNTSVDAIKAVLESIGGADGV
jgi:uncharacterized protein